MSGAPGQGRDFDGDMRSRRDFLASLSAACAAVQTPSTGGGGGSDLVNFVTTNADVEFVDPLIRTPGAGEIQVRSGSLVQSNKTTAATFTIHAADVSNGWTCTVVKWAAGDVTIAAGTGLTLRTAVSATIFSQYGMLQATRIGSDLLVG